MSEKLDKKVDKKLDKKLDKKVDLLDLLDKEHKEVNCLKCKVEIYLPLNSESEKNSYFLCNKCGNAVHFDPIVIIE